MQHLIQFRLAARMQHSMLSSLSGKAFCFCGLVLALSGPGCKRSENSNPVTSQPTSQAVEAAVENSPSAFPIQVAPSADVGNQPSITYDQVLAAQQTILDLESRVQNLPDEIDQETVDHLKEQFLGTVWEASKVARQFVDQSPSHALAREVSQLEKQWVTQLASQHFQPAVQRLSDIVLGSLNDPSVSLEEKYQILVQAVQQAALRERPNGMLAMAHALETGTDQLLNKFPSKIISIDLLLTPLEIYHSLRQTNDFQRVMSRITEVLDNSSASPDLAAESASLRLDFAASLFSFRQLEAARSHVQKVIQLKPTPELVHDAATALSTMDEVLHLELMQDQFIGNKVDLIWTSPLQSDSQALPLTRLPHKAVALVFWSLMNQPTRSLFQDLLALAEKSNSNSPDSLAIVHVLVPHDSQPISADQFLEYLKSQPDCATYAIDPNQAENLPFFKLFPPEILPDVWLLDGQRRLHTPRAHHQLGFALFQILRDSNTPSL